MGILFLSQETCLTQNKGVQDVLVLPGRYSTFPGGMTRVFTGLRVQRNTSAKFDRGEDGTIHLEVGRTEDKLKSTADAKEKYIQRVKLSSKCLPMNNNLKLKRISYITLKYISYKSIFKKYLPGMDILFMVQYIQIQQYSLLLEFYLVVIKFARVYILKKGGGMKGSQKTKYLQVT